jgi:lipopolysaccharide biosynthesis regulator YciM
MFSMNALFSAGLLFLFLVAASRFFTRFFPRKNAKSSLNKEYLVGLNFLLNEQPDKAVDTFIKMLEVDADTVETHLALGKLFRKRGEVDRAIRIHQNLIARPQLEEPYKLLALLALGQDYLTAGVLDRAENTFKEALLLDEKSEEALISLLDIYQQEKEWSFSIEIAQKLSKFSRKDMQKIIAHCYCEIAQRHLQQGDKDGCEFALEKSLQFYKSCVRANLILASLFIQEEDYRQAIKYLKRVKEQNPDYTIETFSPMAACYEKLQDEASFLSYCKTCLMDSPQQAPLYALFIQKLPFISGIDRLNELLVSHIIRYPTLVGLSAYLAIRLSPDASDQTALELVSSHLGEILKNTPNYQCVNCGFSGKNLHWQCPSCRQWETVKSLYDKPHNS